MDITWILSIPDHTGKIFHDKRIENFCTILTPPHSTYQEDMAEMTPRNQHMYLMLNMKLLAEIISLILILREVGSLTVLHLST